MLPACASEPETLRILSYNIHHGEGTDGRFDLERIAGVIDSVKPDLVALQEVDRETRRSSGVDQAAELGRLTGMTAIFGPAMPYQGGEYGDAVLSRRRPSESGHLALPAAANHEPRVATHVTIELEGGAVTFASTHLDHTRDPSDRVRQAEALVDGVVRIVSGDGAFAAYEATDENTQRDIWALPLVGTSEPRLGETCFEMFALRAPLSVPFIQGSLEIVCCANRTITVCLNCYHSRSSEELFCSNFFIGN